MIKIETAINYAAIFYVTVWALVVAIVMSY